MHTEHKMIIDIHTHIFPDRIAPKTIDILLGNIKALHGTCNKAYSDATLEGLKTSMHNASVDLSVVLPIVTNIKSTNSINSFAYDVNRKNVDVISFAGIHPKSDPFEGLGGIYGRLEKPRSAPKQNTVVHHDTKHQRRFDECTI